MRAERVCEYATTAGRAHTTTREILQIVEIWLECSQQVSLDLSSAGAVSGAGKNGECLRPEADNSSGNSDRRTSMLADMMSMMAPTASAPAPKKRKARKAKKAAPKKAAKRKVAKKAKKAAKKTAKRKTAKRKTAKRKTAKKAAKKTAKRKTAKRKTAKKKK